MIYYKKYIPQIRRHLCALQLPTPEQWFVAASVMSPVYFGPSPTSKLGQLDEAISNANSFVRGNGILTNGTSIENRFSESRCAKALPIAMAAYKEGLPQHYLQEFHNAKVVFRLQNLSYEVIIRIGIF